MIDKEKVKKFWDSRAQAYGKVPFESVANLEEDPELLSIKLMHETQVVQKLCHQLHGKTVLDLGAGVGQWAFRFADWGAAKVTAVEYSAELARIGSLEASKRRFGERVDFVVSEAQTFQTEMKFDIIFISGLFVYLNDLDAQKLCSNLRGFSNPNTQIIVRDGTGSKTRHEINDKYSLRLNSQYSAIYRTKGEYIDLFTRNGLTLISEGDMFPKGHTLNKHAESRLRVYLLKPIQ